MWDKGTVETGGVIEQRKERQGGYGYNTEK